MTALLMLVEPLDISKCLVTTFGTKQRLNFYTMLRTNYILLKKLGLQPVVCKSHHGGWGIIIWLESWVSRLKADEATKVEAESEVMNSRKENEANITPVLVEADSCLIYSSQSPSKKNHIKLAKRAWSMLFMNLANWTILGTQKIWV